MTSMYIAVIALGINLLFTIVLSAILPGRHGTSIEMAPVAVPA